MKKDTFVKIVKTNGDYRYGYISEVLEKGFYLGISLFDEGESKIAFDAEQRRLNGIPPINYKAILTDTEKQVVPFLAGGYNTNEIAKELGISPTTVRAHLRTLRIKLHLDSKAQLLALAPGLNTELSKNGRTPVKS
jgi:DNA-binding CsgD family transcriptional regulator